MPLVPGELRTHCCHSSSELHTKLEITLSVQTEAMRQACYCCWFQAELEITLNVLPEAVRQACYQCEMICLLSDKTSSTYCRSIEANQVAGTLVLGLEPFKQRMTTHTSVSAFARVALCPLLHMQEDFNPCITHLVNSDCRCLQCLVFEILMWHQCMCGDDRHGADAAAHVADVAGVSCGCCCSSCCWCTVEVAGTVEAAVS